MEGKEQNWFTQNHDIWKNNPCINHKLLSGYAFYQLSYLPNKIEEIVSLNRLYSKDKIIRINDSTLYIHLYNNEAYIPLSDITFRMKTVGKISIIDSKIKYNILLINPLQPLNIDYRSINNIFMKRKKLDNIILDDNVKEETSKTVITNLGYGKFIIHDKK